MTETMESDGRSFKGLHWLEDIENTSIDKFANYDVFIIHRGPDTKTGFVRFLYKALKAAGLRVFLDCRSIDMGEDCWECMEHAIKKIPVAVVIFSGSFTQSVWCMRELDVTLHSPGTTVLPIFYDVLPSEVRFPESGQLKDGFEKLSGRHDKAVIEGWRADLEQASKLMGWEHVGAHKRLEADLVTDVVEKIVKLANKLLPLAVGEHFVGVQRVAEEIIQKLDNKKEVVVLGLWGMGGIGKSTLAKELYNQLSERFDSACYIEDVTEKVIQGGVVKVQSHILENLCPGESIEIEEIEGKSKGKIILEEMLCKKRILMVLDDVRESDEMEYLISRKMLREGSMCIVTSRNRSVFEASNSFAINHEVYIHDVQLLSSVDSERVFTSHAFGGSGNVRPELEEMVTGISKACGGVPLVLKVCGALLKNEDNVNVWKEVMEKLNCGRIMMDDKKILDCLRISYDDLSEEQQEMFLDIACGLIGQSKDSAVRVWRSFQWYAEFGVWSLIEKALIRVDDDGCLRMHDHLRDMGREIVKKKGASEGVIRRLWMPESLKLLKENEQLPDSLHTLILSDNHDYGSSNDITDLDLSRLKELRILILTSVKTVTSSFPRHLRWLDQVVNYDLHKNMASVPFTPENNELVILKFQGLKIQSLPESFGDLTNLEVLNLSWCRSLTMLPKSFRGLKSVRNLNLERCAIQSLPESFGDLTNLEVLNLSWCSSLTMLPKSFGGLKSVQNLNLEGCAIQSLPESFGDLTNLEVLNLSWCRSLTMLPKSFGSLKSVRNLYLERCEIQCLPESFGDLTNLEVLNLSWCRSLSTLPKSFGGLKSVRNLNLGSCGIESLPESFGDLTNLEVLNLSWCWSLTWLPDSFGGLKSVRNLNLERCGIQSLPDSFGDLTNLEVLNLRLCTSLTWLPKSFGGLKSVRNLNLGSCGIESLPKSFGDLTNLEVLNLSWCRSLTMLPKSFGGLKSVQNLNLEGCAIQSLPKSFGDLTNLEVLNLSWCWSLTWLPDSFGGLKSVRNLNLERCGIESLPESFGDLTNLEVLNLRLCTSLTWLPKSFGGLKSVQNLNLGSCGIESLPKSFGDLTNLEVLNLRLCRSLTLLPRSFGGLKSVWNLNLERCGIQSLPDSFGDLTNLEVLNLRLCTSLTWLPKSFGGLKSVRNLNLGSCGIERLPESFGDLTNLEVLNLSWCRSLTMLPKSFGGLKSVQNLNLEGCGIQSLLESFEDLTNLDMSNLKGYWSHTMLPKSFKGLKSVQNLGVAEKSPIVNRGLSRDDLSPSIQLRMHDLQIEATNVEENQGVGGESQTYHSSSSSSNNAFSDALDNELQKIDNISEVSSNHEDLQSLLDVESLQHEDGIITFCCYDATNVHFDFYFRDAKDMACVAGVGLQYAKVVLVDGWEITVQELSEMQWEQTLGRVRSSSSIVYKSLKLKRSPMLCADVTMSQDFEGYPLLWTLAKYFTLKEALTKFTMANNNDASTSEGSSGVGITQANGNDNQNDTLSTLFGMWFRSLVKGKKKMEEDEDGENEGNGGDPRDEKDGIDKNRDATVSIQLLAGGKINDAKVVLLGENEEEKECYTTLEAHTYEMDAKQRLGVLDKTIRPDLKFVFYIEDGIKHIQCTVGNINFILDREEKWLHHGLRVAFGLYDDYTIYGEVVRSSFKHLDVREGKKGGKGTRTLAGCEGNVQGTTWDCTMKPLGVGGAGGLTESTSRNVTDTRANESSFEYSGDYTRGGLEFKAIIDPDDHVIEYRYSSRDHRSYEDLPPTAPLRMGQDVKFQTTFEVIEDPSQLAENFVEYKLTASRCLEEVKSPELTLENLNARLLHPGKHEKLLIIFNQRYEKTVLLNHGMTHLDGRHHKLYEREIAGRKIFAGRGRRTAYEWTCKLGTKVHPLAKPSSSEAPRARASLDMDVDM